MAERGDESRSSSAGSRPTAATPWRRLAADRAARWAISGGGMTIILSILGILLFILVEVWPLTRAPRVDTAGELRLTGPPPQALLTDEYRANAVWLRTDGRLQVMRLADGALTEDVAVLAEDPSEQAVPLRVQAVPGQHWITAATNDGRLLAVPVDWNVEFVGDDRHVTAEIGDTLVFDLDAGGRAPAAFAVRVADDGAALAVAAIGDGLVLVRRAVEENMFTGETTESWERSTAPLPEPVDRLLLDQARGSLYGSGHDGTLWRWQLREGVPVAAEPVRGDGVGISAMSLLIGDRSLVVARQDGTVEVWFAVRQEDGGSRMTRTKRFRGRGEPVVNIAPSLRDKSFLALDAAEGLTLYHSTSERVLWRGEAPVERPSALYYTPKADGALVASGGRLGLLDIDNPHPEVSLGSLFGRVWYEGYERPQHVWQSSGGTDDFEPKLGLTPLMVGTLKGTFYSLLLAIPLGVLGAMYTSQFMHPSMKRVVKPTVEIMAALPSVVLGFLAGLWLAPRVERFFPALLLMLVLFPIAVLTVGMIWRGLSRGFRARFPSGFETFLYALALIVAGWLSIQSNDLLAQWMFGGDFQEWLLASTGLRYDQRNAVVIGLAMGFAVIPIIFSIAEDAFANVPGNLISGSLALGASRWQTVTRVVLPTASPGIFSGIMIGFGRAVGETMIVLMATGNTPIMDWSPFNGFRTLSANIAVEIPEAPHGGTLYRTLFLAALILFVFTFLLNTLAELVRQRLRQRYSQL